MNGFLILLHSVLVFFLHSLSFLLHTLSSSTHLEYHDVHYANYVCKRGAKKMNMEAWAQTYLVLISTNKNASHWANKSECIRWYRARVQACKHWQTHCTQIETGIGKIPTIKWNCIAHLNANERLYTIEMLSCFPKTHSLFTTSAPLFADTS